MAYAMPTVVDFKARFPEFADTAPETITAFMNAATLWVDESWFERDYPYAIIYLAAHYLQMYQDALASGAIGGSGGGGTGGTDVQTFISSIAFEDFKVQMGNAGKTTNTSSAGGTGASSSAALMAMSVYGLLYVQLRRRNIVPAAII